MTLGMFIGLIVIPGLILLTAFVCYAIVARRDVRDPLRFEEQERSGGER